MTEEPSIQRLADRLADLRQLGDRNRAAHPVSVLRNDIVAGFDTPGSGAQGRGTVVAPAEPNIEQRAEALARRLLSPVLARAEQLAESIRRA
jgi:hypothetical protein